MSLELYIGPMFAGKSSCIIGTLRRHAFIHRPTLCITNALDTRYSASGVVISHDKESYPATAISQLSPMLDTDEFTNASCIIIEEAQFFPDLKEFVLAAVEIHAKQVICVGLDGDSERRPFGQLLELIPFADNVTKFKALCGRCQDGTHAIFSYRKHGIPPTQINVGSEDKYEALCRTHYLNAKKLDMDPIQE